MVKEDVASIVCRENRDNQLVLATLDIETQKQAAEFKPEWTYEVAHLMSVQFIEWLILEASAVRWSKEDVGRIVCRENRDGQLLLATLDPEASGGDQPRENQ